jgi:hypothetical protein
MTNSLLNDKIINELKKLGATHYSQAFNYDKPHENNVSSIHFFTSNENNQNNGFPECAHFIPDMHSVSLGELSGFSICHRLNNFDTNLLPLTFD